jgi:Ca2+-binding RTX toxin-like protein
MRKRSALVATSAAVAIMGVLAQPAAAGLIRVDTSTAGVTRLLFSEPRVSANDPLDPTKMIFVAEENRITVRLAGDTYEVTDAASPLSFGAGCAQVDPNTVQCSAPAVTQLVFLLGQLNDSFDNQTATPARVMGQLGSDRIINAGGGDDTVELRGNEADTLDSCGDGNDTVTTDKRDTVPSTSGCEVINGVTQGAGGGGSTGGGGGSSGSPGAPAAPSNLIPISQSALGTPAPVSLSALVVAPTAKKGACDVPFIGTIAADRIDGSADGDIEYGQAGDDYMNGQAGDDCLYGLDGNDTMLGDDGLDLVVGGNGKDAGYGGNGNDRLYGVAGVDRLSGDRGDDRVSGGLGNDRLRGGAGNDQLFGGPGNDEIDSGPGNDTASGGAGRDHIVTGPGADRVSARDRTRDVVNCGPGRDSVSADKVDVLRNCERVTRR